MNEREGFAMERGKERVKCGLKKTLCKEGV